VVKNQVTDGRGEDIFRERESWNRKGGGTGPEQVPIA